jgi:hypothetical protein
MVLTRKTANSDLSLSFSALFDCLASNMLVCQCNALSYSSESEFANEPLREGFNRHRHMFMVGDMREIGSHKESTTLHVMVSGGIRLKIQSNRRKSLWGRNVII